MHMPTPIVVAAVVLPVAVISILVVVILRLLRGRGRGREQGGENGFADAARIRNIQGLQSGIAKVQLGYKKSATLHSSYHDFDKKNANYYVSGHRDLPSTRPFLSWTDHPSLVSDAVEYGWPRFGFAGQNMASTTSTTTTGSILLGLCASGDQVRESKAEISWEICPDSAEFMQKVRLNSGLKSCMLDTTPGFPLGGVSCATQTALPLPGPFLGASSFPQEAYFEITILTARDSFDNSRRVKDRKSQGEKSRLIQQSVDMNVQSDERRISLVDEGTAEAVPISVGLSVGGSHPQRLPGSYYGSIGFNSDGSVYLDGIKLMNRSKWGDAHKDTVIGCGFDPSQKKVFFTVDSELEHVIQCKSEEFSRPLYPTLAANIDVTVIMNLGQSSFKYAPANIHRTPNPCFIGSTAALGYEDSKELFSMGRIDSEWLDRCTTKSSATTERRKIGAYDDESDADLFEIVLDNMKRSPSTYL